MRRRITWLVALVTSAVVFSFVLPLCLLVRTLAVDRAMAAGSDQAQSVAILVSQLQDNPSLARTVAEVNDPGRAEADRTSGSSRTDEGADGDLNPSRSSVLLPDGEVVGTPAPDLPRDPGAERAATDGSFSEVTDVNGRIYVPVKTETGTYVVRTTVPSSALREGVLRAWLVIIGLGLLLTAAAIAIADRLGRRISEPVTDLAVVAQRLQDGELQARARPHGPEETVELAQTLNGLAERIVELLALERAAVGDLSHRLRTPVTALRLDADALVEGGADADLGPRLQRHIELLQRTIDAVVRDARRPLRSELTSSADATRLVAERAAYWQALAEDQGRPVDVVLPSGAVLVSLDAVDLTDIIDVLVDNVFAHTHQATGFSIRLERVGNAAVLEVANGADPPGRRAIRNAFEEVRTGGGAHLTSGGATRSATAVAESPQPGTTGLGLDIVRRTAAQAGGRLTIRHDHGFVARVTLPLSEAVTEDP